MSYTADAVTEAVVAAACQSLEECRERIWHCLQQLSDDQVWWRPQESMNSIGNLVLHLSGNIRQWIVAGVGNAEDNRHRPSEFSQREALDKRTLLDQLDASLQEALATLRRASAEDMMVVRRIQGWDVTGWQAVFDCVPHFKGHTQEIICLTRMQLGDDYQFHWQPESPEQGAE